MFVVSACLADVDGAELHMLNVATMGGKGGDQPPANRLTTAAAARLTWAS